MRRTGRLFFLLLLFAGCERPGLPAQPRPLALPAAPVADGATISLACGKTYRGTLDLKGKSRVTVRTAGNCGKATISPGGPVTGWTRHRGRIYSAPLDYVPAQVALAGVPVTQAHWPNRGWARTGLANVSGPMPPGDLRGARLVWLENQSVVAAEVLATDRVDTDKPYYVEGKLWMLDSADEWAYAGGRLYIWSPDGRSPEGRAWAAPDAAGIDADKSDGVTIDNIRIFAATDGIRAEDASALSVLRTDIANAARDGIWASGSDGLRVDASSVSNARRSGIDGWYRIVNARITDTTVDHTGMSGQPSPTDAGIFFGDGAGNRIEKVRVRHSAYHGISVLHNRATQVLDSSVEQACARLTDCGGIYTGARDRKPLGLTIAGNTVADVRGHEGVGIYLDDFANGVRVERNTIRANTRGMLLHNAFDNIISGNRFDANSDAHLVFAQDNGTIRHNRVTGNIFSSGPGAWTYKLEAGANLKTFASFDGNTYANKDASVFARSWDGRSYGVTHSWREWKAWSGQDGSSTMTEKDP